jgi:hypothetical protein
VAGLIALQWCADGGKYWSWRPATTGGQSIATAGRTGAFLPEPFNGLYHTEDGVDWTMFK